MKFNSEVYNNLFHPAPEAKSVDAYVTKPKSEETERAPENEEVTQEAEETKETETQPEPPEAADPEKNGGEDGGRDNQSDSE